MNPFKYGQLVSGEDFCPRPKLQKQIKDLIISGQNILIQGRQRVGKSSLIYETARSIKKKRLLYVDLLHVKSVDNLCKRIIKSILSLEQKTELLEKSMKTITHLRPIFSIDTITRKPRISLHQNTELQTESLEEIVDLIREINSNKPLIVVLDEFQDIRNLSNYREILSILQGKIQFYSSLPYIFMVSIHNTMHDMFKDSEISFLKSLITVEGMGLEEQTFNPFLYGKFLTGKRGIGDSIIHQLMHISENITGDIQQICNAIWEITSFKEKIGDEQVNKALKIIFSRESKGYESTLDILTALQIKCLFGLAKMGGASPLSASFIKNIGGLLPASINRSLKRMEQLKIIYRKYGEYKFINPFFKLWLVHNDQYF